jgi:transposase
MGRAEVLQGVRQMRFEALLARHERGELNQEEAAEMLGISERTFRRWRDRLRDEGPSGLIDRRIGKPSSRRAATEEILRMLGLYEERYAGSTAKHFHEQLRKRHNYKLGYTVTRLSLQAAGLLWPAPKRSAHRRKRPRRPLPGMMLHQDASRFAWLPGEVCQYDLAVTLDDATSTIYSAFLVEEESTLSSFRGIAEVIDQHGLFCELYTDRGSHYFHTPKAGEAVSKTVRTQVGRALAQLGIRHIAAYSPEARGRSERAFRTLQDRLPKELALTGIVTIEAANRWIAESYLPAHNTAFAVAPEQAGSAFVPDRIGAAHEILCFQEERRVGNDNTVKWRGLPLQIPSSPWRAHFDGARARVSRRAAGDLPWSTPLGQIRTRWIPA